MTFTLTLGWWVVPAVFTVASLLAVRLFWPRMEQHSGSMYPDIGGAIVEAVGYGAALMVSLAVWLVWALAS